MKHSQLEQAILAFPATHPDGQKYLEAAPKRGFRTVGMEVFPFAQQPTAHIVKPAR